MTTIERVLAALQQQGYAIDNPRPRFSPRIETALAGELDEEVTHGEKEPTATPDLPANVQRLSKNGRAIILYLLESALDAGFWGVNANVITELNQQPLPWALVLLDGSGDSGYWLRDNSVASLAAQRWQPIVPNGANYEVRAPADLTEATRFVTADHLLGLVASLAE